MSKDGPHYTTKGLRPSVKVLIALQVVVALALARTAYVASQGRALAAQGLAASSYPVTALSEIREQIAELTKQLSEAQHGAAAEANSSSSRLQQQLQQLKQEFVQGLAQPLLNTTKAYDSLLHHAAKADEQFSELQRQVTHINSKLTEPTPAPQGVKVDEKELHHVVTHTSVCDKGTATQGLSLNVTEGFIAPLVVVGHNRPGYLARTMVTLLKYWTSDPSYAHKFPLFISIDGQDQRTLLLATAMHQATGVQIITRRREGGPHCPTADCHISQHYKLLLQLFLQCFKAPGIMFLEEDLEIAPDFFSYFEALSPLMARDNSIYCISAWNDHGQRGRAKDNRAVYRTDVMPGLGWYLNAAVGLELAPKWPLTNWDDWMRLPGIKNGRSCIFPEVPRTHTFGRIGTHPMGHYFDILFDSMMLNQESINWHRMDVHYLLKQNYDVQLNTWLDNAEVFSGTLEQLQAYCAVNQTDDTEHTGDMVYRYPAGKLGWERTTSFLKPMLGDVREGTPRGSYNGHAVVRCRGRRLFLRAS